MIAVSRRWRALVGRMGRWRPYAEWSVGGGWRPAELISGTVTDDATQQIRWTCDLVLRGVDADPHQLAYGGRVRVGVELLDTGERAAKGVYRINQVERSLLSDLVGVSGQSWEAFLVDARLPAPLTMGRQSAAAMMDRLTAGMGTTVSWQGVDGTRVLPRMTVARDRWGAIYGSNDADQPSIARALGAEVFTDEAGQLIVARPPALSDQPVWTMATGRGGVQLSAQEAFDRDPVYNAVSVRGTSTEDDIPVVGPITVVDDDPESNSYWHRPISQGGFGPKPLFYASPLITTPQQAFATGASMLAKRLGLKKTVEFEQHFDPAKESRDVGVIDTPSGPERVIVDQISLDLGALSMTGQVRASSSTRPGTISVLEEGGDDEG